MRDERRRGAVVAFPFKQAGWLISAGGWSSHMMNRRFVSRRVAMLAAVSVAVGSMFGSSARAEDKADDKPIRALLVAGGCCHDYAKQKDLLTQGISARANVTWTISYDPAQGTKHLNPVYEKGDD